MTLRTDSSSARRFGGAFTFLSALTVFALQSTVAMALSSGCTGFNYSTNLNPGATGTAIDLFEAGEVLTITVTTTGSAGFSFTLDATTVNFSMASAATQTQSISVTSTGGLGFSYGVNPATTAPITVTYACGLAPPAPPPSTSSSLLDQVRKRFSRLAAQTSTANVGESVTDALNDAFNGGGTTRISNGRVATSFAAVESGELQSGGPRSAYAAARDGWMPVKAPPRVALSPWHVWIDTRFTGQDDRNVSAFDGYHTNVTGGVSYRFTGDFIGGVVLGYEDFGYELGLRNAELSGDGWHGGGYFGWRFFDRLRLDGMLTYGRVSYGAQADAVTGGFDADRVTGMLRVSGRWSFAPWYLEPSARIIYARESQDAFTDTAGIVHGDYAFDVGTASFGSEFGVPCLWAGGVLTPTLGLFGDYRFGDDTVSTVALLPDVNDGWAARVTGGLQWASANGFSASVGADYGGLGQDIHYWRLRASAGVKF